MRRLIILLIFSLFGLTACTTEYRVVQIPLRSADLYPRSRSRAQVTVAADGITDRERVATYFGVDLFKRKILPVNIIVSNHGSGRYIVKPSDVMLMKGNEVLDPMPVESLVEVAVDLHARISDKTAKQVNTYFANLALQETVLVPQDSCQGVMFFKIKEDEEEDHSFVIRRLFREGSMKIYIGVTNAETGERTIFDLYL
ncbi:MAG TPA: hypothetical protein VEJ22_05865 [Nitrospirota bacterium]|nr:hypothetical protein [Nitrospirota bacterium]